jgi:hypothetical protein
MDAATAIIAVVTSAGLLAVLGLFVGECTGRSKLTRNPASPFAHGYGRACLAAMVAAATCLVILMVDTVIALGDNFAYACGSWLGPCPAAYVRQDHLQGLFVWAGIAAGVGFLAIAVCSALAWAWKGLAHRSGR